MRFHALLVVRDEVDLIDQTLAHLLSWADSLHVLDTGSTDGTWELIRGAARREGAGLATAQRLEGVPFFDGLRAWLFDRVRDRFSPGDWVARVDADEFFHVPPPRFVAAHCRRGEGRVFGVRYDFRMTESDVAAWEAGSETGTDRARPIEARRRRYVIDDYPEPRLFRYRRSMRWPPWATRLPAHAGVPCAARIPVRHYRFRDPVQMAARQALRARVAGETLGVGRHWEVADWRREVVRDDDPNLRMWEEGAELPPVECRNHLGGPARLAGLRLFHRAGLACVADRFRRGWPAGTDSAALARMAARETGWR